MLNTVKKRGWLLGAILISIPTVLPLGFVFSSFFMKADSSWEYIINTLLSRLLLNSLVLVAGVGALSLILGVSLAWINSFYDYPGRKYLSGLLLYPLAFPSYVLAFVSIGILDYTGPIQTILRSSINYNGYFPQIRSTPGLIIVMSLALYPYIYLLTKNAFQTQGQKLIEVAQSLGHSRSRAFFSVVIPMARPWIAGGLLLVLMETLADFGTVSTFNYDTFTTAIYKAWFSLFSIQTASRLASFLVILALILVFLEQNARKKMKFNQVGRHDKEQSVIRLRGWKAFIAFSYSFLILSLAFIIPVIQLLFWIISDAKINILSSYGSYIWHTIILSCLAAFIVLVLAFCLSLIQRKDNSFITKIALRIATLGYALPGSVLAVGIFVSVIWLDKKIIIFLEKVTSYEFSFILNGTIIVMLIAYAIRFLSPGFNTISSSFERIPPSVDEAATSLGVGTMKMLKKIHIPLIKKSLLAGYVLVFIDVTKEMPITLMTRPFGWDTLAVKIFEYTSEGEWELAAIPALLIVLAGLIPITLLSKLTEEKKTNISKGE